MTIKIEKSELIKAISSVALEEIDRLEKETSVLSEISKQTLGSYIKKSHEDSTKQHRLGAESFMKKERKDSISNFNRAFKRDRNIEKSIDKLSTEKYYEVSGTKEGKEMKVSIPAKSRDEAMQLAHQKGLTNIKLHKKEE